MGTFRSDLSGKEFPETERVSAQLVRPSILRLMVKEHPQFTEDHFLSLSELNFYREQYISESLGQQLGELSELDKRVLAALSGQTTLSDKIDTDEDSTLSFGQRVADHVATFGGSWTFIISFGCFLLVWILLNAFWLANRGFDPYPFILLNLILSCIAALQAPVIMMSQNRQEEKDRERARKDYMINLKAELEIRILHEKIDHLMLHQQQTLLEIQKVQGEMMNDILRSLQQR